MVELTGTVEKLDKVKQYIVIHETPEGCVALRRVVDSPEEAVRMMRTFCGFEPKNLMLVSFEMPVKI